MSKAHLKAEKEFEGLEIFGILPDVVSKCNNHEVVTNYKMNNNI